MYKNGCDFKGLIIMSIYALKGSFMTSFFSGLLKLDETEAKFLYSLGYTEKTINYC